MLQNARSQFVRTVLIVAVVALLALSLQGAVLFSQGGSVGLNLYPLPSLAPDDAPADALACVPPGGSQGGGCCC